MFLLLAILADDIRARCSRRDLISVICPRHRCTELRLRLHGSLEFTAIGNAGTQSSPDLVNSCAELRGYSLRLASLHGCGCL
jgi:hypothetical protein